MYGGQDVRIQAISLRRGVKIVIGTPGRVLDLLKRRILKTDSISTLVLDEADEMLSMGFFEEVTKIIEKVPKNTQKLFFSATIDNRVKDIANKKAKKAIYVECKDNKTMLVDNIKQIAIDVKEKMKNECVLRILKKKASKCSVVFCNTKKKTEINIASTIDTAIIASFALSLNIFFKNLSIASSSSSSSSIKNSEE